MLTIIFIKETGDKDLKWSIKGEFGELRRSIVTWPLPLASSLLVLQKEEAKGYPWGRKVLGAAEADAATPLRRAGRRFGRTMNLEECESGGNVLWTRASLPINYVYSCAHRLLGNREERANLTAARSFCAETLTWELELSYCICKMMLVTILLLWPTYIQAKREASSSIGTARQSFIPTGRGKDDDDDVQ